MTDPATPTAPAAGRAAQRAFAGLLARPLVTAASDPELYRMVTRHLAAVRAAARVLGYRLASSGQAFRLVRVPVDGAVTAPPPPAGRPERRVLALTCVLAAAAADVTGPVSLAELSGQVEQLTTGAAATVSPYEPSLLAHRRQLIAAAGLLEYWGVLRRRPAGPAPDPDWTGSGDGPGPSYDVDPAALELLTSPDVLAAALARPPEPAPASAGDGASRLVRTLRALAETPAVLYAELDGDDAASLRATRALRSREVTSLLGGQVEARAEGLALIIDDEPRNPLTADWPGPGRAGWVSLLLADAAARAGQGQPDGAVTLTSAQVDEQASALLADRPEELGGDPAAVRAAAERQLVPLGLVRVGADGGWWLSPVAGRYRATVDHPVDAQGGQP
ncbi:MAG: DUF2398 family protein [Actinobacteria bacterium]|nr:DUF2398 family protein [Actinomycetota bacterium]